jgi:hypothetical protein
MSVTERGDEPDPPLQPLRVIVVTLTAGVSMFLLIAVFVLRSGKPFSEVPWSIDSPLTLVALVLAAAALTGSFLLPSLIASTRIRQLTPNPNSGGEGGWQSWSVKGRAPELFAIYHTGVVIGAAMLEGAAFFALIVYFLEGVAPPLLVAAVLLVALASRFPTRSRVEEWITRQDGAIGWGETG